MIQCVYKLNFKELEVTVFDKDIYAKKEERFKERRRGHSSVVHIVPAKHCLFQNSLKQSQSTLLKKHLHGRPLYKMDTF